MEVARQKNPEFFETMTGFSMMTSDASDPNTRLGASVFPETMRFTLDVIRELGGFEAYWSRSLGAVKSTIAPCGAR